MDCFAPYRIDGPAVVSFSGGRTSAFMLWHIVQAHGGRLPDDMLVVFANTGKERPETLRFVHECGTRWGVDIVWVEWRDTADGFERIGFNSASREGEPFERLIAKKQRLPNGRERWCTEYLKVRPIHAVARHMLGLEPGRYVEVIGLRDDEGLRVLKGLAKAEETGRRVRYPLAKAKVAKGDVLAFWRDRPFDLGLEPWEGNCTLCFLKGRAIRKRIIRDHPDCAAWWSGMEDGAGGRFDNRDSVADLVREVTRSPELGEVFDPEEFDAECGLLCGGAT
jgi:hypothetical protein